MLQVFIVVKGRYYKIIRLAHFARRMIMINEQAASSIINLNIGLQDDFRYSY